MPRPKASAITTALRQVQKQARTLLIGFRKEIRGREAELLRLKADESRLSRLIGDGARAGGDGMGGRRTDWRAVLTQVPKQFKASHVRAVRGLASKRASEIFGAITRWIAAGAVKRKARGLYERLGLCLPKIPSEAQFEQQLALLANWQPRPRSTSRLQKNKGLVHRIDRLSYHRFLPIFPR